MNKSCLRPLLMSIGKWLSVVPISSNILDIIQMAKLILPLLKCKILQTTVHILLTALHLLTSPFPMNHMLCTHNKYHTRNSQASWSCMQQMNTVPPTVSSSHLSIPKQLTILFILCIHQLVESNITGSWLQVKQGSPSLLYYIASKSFMYVYVLQ